jgi:hypothetical protein
MKTKSVKTTIVRALALGATAAFPSSWRRGLLTALLTVLGLTAGNAAVIFTDTFTGVTTGTLNSNGWYFNASSGTEWVIGTNNLSPLSGNVLQNPGGTASGTYALKQFTSQTLSLGQSLTLQVDYNNTVNTGGQYALWLGNTATTLSGNSLNMGAGYPFPADFTAYNAWGVSNTNPDAPGFNEYQTGVVNTMAFAGSAIIGNTNNPSTLALTLTRVATGTQLEWFVNGTPLGSYIDTNAPFNTFNTVALFGQTNSPSFDNVSVSVVPEPSTFAMLALFGGAFAVWRKRVVRRRSSV